MVTQEDSQSVANELETKIIRQIEYYFSDINLSKDKFLKELIPKDDGWVTFEILLTFKRLNALSGDKEVIVKALRKSSSNLLEISECETKLRRNPEKPLPEINDEYTQELNERTLHLKGFPTDAKLDDIMEFCRQYGTVENIEMRRHMKSKTFKGCIFVVFATKDEAQKVLTADEVKYDGKDLLRENKVTYWARKKEFSERRQRKGGKPVVKDENASGDGKPESVINSVRFAGAVLKLSGLPTDAKFSDIKTLFLKYGPVAYVEAVNAQQESFVRFGAENGAKNALEKAKIKTEVKAEDGEKSEVKTEDGVVGDKDEVKTEDGKKAEESDAVSKVEICGTQVTAVVLTGGEEIQYWNEFEKNRILNNQKKNDKKFQGRGGRKGKGMWQRNKKRGYQGSGDRNGSKRSRADSD